MRKSTVQALITREASCEHKEGNSKEQKKKFFFDGKVGKNFMDKNQLPGRNKVALPGTLQLLLLAHPGTFATLKRADAQGRPGPGESWIQRQKRVGFCNCVAACWEGSISAQMHLKIKYGRGECFLEMENEC